MGLDKIHVLLTMAEADSGQLVACLKESDYDVYESPEVRQSVEYLERGLRVDLIVADLNTLTINGQQFLRHLRGSQRMKRIPVIAYARAIDRERAIRVASLGVHEFLIWPCPEDVLFRKIKQVLQSGCGSVLVVDDEPIIRDLLVGIVRREGFQVAAAANGKDALAIMERQKVSLVITDLMMPEMDGMELLVEVKEKYPGTPVVLVTGKRSKAARGNAMAAQADGYIIKPFKNLEIAQKIESLVSA